MKLFWAGMSQRVSDTAVAVLGPESLLMPDDEHAVDRGRWALGLLATRANSIMGGTSEIQRNILARAPPRAAPRTDPALSRQGSGRRIPGI